MTETKASDSCKHRWHAVGDPPAVVCMDCGVDIESVPDSLAEKHRFALTILDETMDGLDG